jgi:hypothetical protein
VENKSLCSLYFQEVEDGNWMCVKCGIKRKKGNGWTNLITHIKSTHSDEWKSDYQKRFELKTSNKSAIQPTAWAYTIYGWIDYMLSRNESPTFCEDPIVRQYTNLADIDVDTLNKYLNEVRMIILFDSHL